ncbi:MULTISPECIES: FxDxF family PEP-CTERM protein [unclassified Duganella]|uniref:FxDxF family PEP-CTERM protein n=1 Tax=unclassified Duganella TaxID=2636909 RepID=UPI0008934826|nr:MULTISPECIES: FxDxF family PEP-CTERM protein [unclassified Duganella]OEZ63837.1 PEP-CTERM motif protein [Duganella sp. HH105]OFA07009.1 PEP-CTERM motif protein [Duganella sp. HH101]
MKLKLVAAATLVASSFAASAATYDLGTLSPLGFDSWGDSSVRIASGTTIDDTWTFALLKSSTTSFLASQTFAVTSGAISNFSAELLGNSFVPGVGTATSQTLSWGGILGAGTYSVHVTGLTNADRTTYQGAVSALPVPEPETYAMLLAGLGIMGLVARRRPRV